MKLTIIMPVWLKNEELVQLTENTLHSLAQTEDLTDFETIIIDNGSPIKMPMLEETTEVYIRNSTNRGYAAAVNQGFALSRGDLITVANNDIRVSPNWLRVTNEILKSTPSAGSVHFRMVEYDEQSSLGRHAWTEGKERWCSSSFFVLKREVIDKVGVYDEGYGLGGGEDWDFWKRVRDAGFKTVYTNGAFYQHKDSSTSNQRDPEERAESDRKAKELFKTKFGEYPDLLFAKEFPNQVNKPWRPFP